MCSVCGAATTYPAPSEAELERGLRRSGTGRLAGGSPRAAIGCSDSRGRRWPGAWTASRLRVRSSTSGRATGRCCGALRARGREAVGLEAGRAVAGCVAGEIEDFDDRRVEWAAVVFWHSLEHLRDPAGRSGSGGRACSLPAGVLAIAVPNLSSWQARCFGEHWFHLDLPRHLVHLPVCRARRPALRRADSRSSAQPLARGPDPVRVASRDRGRCRAIPTSTARSAVSGAQDDRRLSGPGGWRADGSAPALAPSAALLAAAEVDRPRRGHRLSRGPAGR